MTTAADEIEAIQKLIKIWNTNPFNLDEQELEELHLMILRRLDANMKRVKMNLELIKLGTPKN